MAASLVSSSRFKLIDVPRRVSIREFTAANGLDFAAGKGFYELMKPELIQDYKEIVAVRRSDGSKITGAKVRELLGIPSSATKFRLDTDKLSDFKVFVQSTSYNRVLLPGTQFLYEVDDGDSDSSSDDGSDSSSDDSSDSSSDDSNDNSSDDGSDIVLTHERPPAPPCGAGMPLEIVLSFDTTGSMSSVLTAVRKRLQELIERLHRDIPGIRIAVFAHGDYSAAKSSYPTEYIDFTTDARALCDFVRNAKMTDGGDWEECYELVLKEVREKLSWTPGTQRALVMIGDAEPHEPDDYRRKSLLRKFPRIVWKNEVDAIVRETGCRIYAVQCLNDIEATDFWKYMAYHTHGYHLNLKNFSSVLDFIMAICYREQGVEQLQAYRAEVEERTRAHGGVNAELHRLFEALGVPTVPMPPTSVPPTKAIASPSAPTRRKPTGKKAGSAAAPSSAAGRKRKAEAKTTAAAPKRARTTGATKKATSPTTPRSGGVVKRGATMAARPVVSKRGATEPPKSRGSRKAPAKVGGARIAGAAKGMATSVKVAAKDVTPKGKPAPARRPERGAAAAASASAADTKKKTPPKPNPKKK